MASIIAVRTDQELLTLLEEGSFHFDLFGHSDNIFTKIRRSIFELFLSGL